jgi:hypothetical protein
MTRHDLRTRLYLDGQWQDITDTVYQRDPVEISRGRTDESDETPPQTCTMTLDNRSGDFSMRNPMGQWFGALNRNVPLEVGYVLATDTFSRTVASGFGTADSGQTWSGIGAGGSVLASDFNVASGVGTMSVPTDGAYRFVVMDGFSQKDIDVQVDVSIPFADVLGGQVEPGNILLRYQDANNYYMIRAAAYTDETVLLRLYAHVAGVSTTLTDVVTTPTTFTGQTLTVRAQVEGQTLRAKVWATGADEPFSWQVETHDDTFTDAGSVGVRCGVAFFNTNPKPIIFSLDNFTAVSPRFAGEVANWPSGSDVSNTDRYVSIEAAGILRRLGQGTSPQRSTMREGIPGLIGADLMAYWPCEDGNASASVASAFVGHPAMTLTGRPDFAEYDDLDSTEPIPLVRGSTWVGDVPSYTLTGTLDIRFIVVIPEDGYGSNVRLIEFETAGSAYRISLSYAADTGSGESANLKITSRTGATVYDVTPVGFPMSGQRMFWYMRFTQSGADINADWGYTKYDDGLSLGVSTTIFGQTVGRATKVTVNPDHSDLLDDVAFGHIWVRNNGGSLGTAVTDLFHAYREETALDRMIRLCEGNGIPFTYTESEPDDTVQMGPQRVDTLLNQIRECAASDGGTLHEPSGVLGITYRTRRSAYGQDPALTLDVSANEVAAPFQPVEDDQQTRNDVEVKNVNGSSARATLETGRMSVHPYPDGIDRYDSRVDINIYPDSALPDHAWWRVALGTVDEARYPDLAVDLDAKPDLIPSILDLSIDDRVHVTDASSVGIYDTIRQLVRGYSERWTNHRGVFRINATPYAPYDVAVLDTGNMRFDSGSSTLAFGYTSSSTSLIVSSTAELWTTSAGDFPFDITVSGEAMTVTNITGSSSPQTFTVTRSVNGVVKDQAAGAEVHVLNPFRIGL